jgi:hypothetical protein
LLRFDFALLLFLFLWFPPLASSEASDDEDDDDDNEESSPPFRGLRHFLLSFVLFEDPLLRLDLSEFDFLDYLECDDFFDCLKFDSTDVIVSVLESESLDDEDDDDSDEEEESLSWRLDLLFLFRFFFEWRLILLERDRFLCFGTMLAGSVDNRLFLMARKYSLRVERICKVPYGVLTAVELACLFVRRYGVVLCIVGASLFRTNPSLRDAWILRCLCFSV